MKNINFLIILNLTVVLYHPVLLAENMILGSNSNVTGSIHPGVNEKSPRVLDDGDGKIGPNEYVKMDLVGGVTKSTCPYSCEDGGVPKQFCKVWESVLDPNECWIQDIRIISDAIPLM